MKITITELKQIYNPKGDIFHAMKKSDDGFCGFGEAYFSTIAKGEIKGWKKHTKMTMNLIVPDGEIEFVLYDGAEFLSITLSRQNYKRITVPSGLWMAFRGVGEHNMLLNIADLEHNPDEAIGIDLDEIKYDW